jgi:hypothetical protein
MNQVYIILLFTLTVISCSTESINKSSFINPHPEFKNITYKKDSLILHEVMFYSEERDFKKWGIEPRGVDRYSCSYDSIIGLRIVMTFGLFPGERINITVKDDSVNINHSSWGCTTFNDFTYITIKQNLVLNSEDFNSIDSIIGFIHYEGVRDIRSKIEEWESNGGNPEWVKNFRPAITRVKGYFKFKIFDNFSDTSEEYDRYNLFRSKNF